MGLLGIHPKFIFLLFLLAAGPFLYSQSKDPLRIGVYENSPKIFVDDEGNAKGIFIDIISEIAGKEDLEVKYVRGEWQELKHALLKGQIDVLPDFAYSPARDSLFTLNAIPVLSSWLEAYSLKGKGFHSFKDLDQKKVGVLKGSVQETFFSEDPQHPLSLDLELNIYSGYPESIEALRNGEINILVASRFFYFSDHFSEDITPTGIIFRPSDLYFAFNQNVDPDLVNLFDRNLAEMKNDPDSNYYKIIHSWLDPVLRSDRQNYFLWILAVLLVILLIVLIFTILLRYQVKITTRALWRRNRQLTRAKEKAEENERLKTIFLQNMSHEIRTPMNGIIGFLNLLKKPNLDAASREKYIDIVNKSGKRLLTTINNIIEISKIDSQQVQIRTSEVDLIEILNYYFNFFLPQAKEKELNLVLKCDIPKDQSVIVTDKFILDNILTNLINNALKFTNKGTVELGAEVEHSLVKFYVKDTGIGIPEDRKNAIFKRFVQANLNMTRAHEGSGLGLAIVKAYVELLKGEIWLESTEGKGSTFFFSIPFIPAENPPLPEEPQALEKKLEDTHLKILVAEDDNISFLFIQQLLNLPGINLIRASDGKEAIEFTRKNPDLSLILMDIKMPHLSGIEATREIRKFNPGVPIIAQSAYTFSGEQEQAFEAGCNNYITKPIDKTRLLEIIRFYSQEIKS
jgi:signal transduction histidine kinase/CheY-like chemotaxis protein